MTDDLQARAERAGVATAYDDWSGRRVEIAPEAVERVLAALDAAPSPPQPQPSPPSQPQPSPPSQPQPSPPSQQQPPPSPPSPSPPSQQQPQPPSSPPQPQSPQPQSPQPQQPSPQLSVSAPAAPGADHPITRLPGGAGRSWGWQLQLYQLRSARSWGIGDYRDLATMARAFAAQGASALLVNPMHAMTPPAPGGRVQNSPYFPSSRRFSDQLGIAIEDLPEYDGASADLRARVDVLKPPGGGRIDRDAVWAAKRSALALLAPGPGAEPAPEPASAADGGPGPVVLREFGTFCALAEVYGNDWREWPEELRRPGPAAASAAEDASVDLHVWIQTKAREQLLAAQTAAAEAGMSIGLIHDLAVGVDPGGADAWLSQDDLAAGFSIGAPPDSYNQLGQDWGLPPWRPDRLAATGYEPLREVARAALSLGGGLRVDHVMGLFRLWWVPAGESAREGTYVSYDGRAMLDVITSEAAAVGAIAIGEDLGTVSPAVTKAMAESGVLGSAVLWFETDDHDVPLPPSAWREAAAASISTHDLPTAFGQLVGEPARVRHELGQLGHALEVEQARAARERELLESRLRDEGLLAAGADAAATVEAMHRLLFRTPSRLILLAPADAVGDVRQPNLPGTTDEYPNWRLPLADGTGAEVGLEALLAHPGTLRLAEIAREEIAQPGRSQTIHGEEVA